MLTQNAQQLDPGHKPGHPATGPGLQLRCSTASAHKPLKSIVIINALFAQVQQQLTVNGPALRRRWWFIGYPGLVALAPFGLGDQGAMLAFRRTKSRRFRRTPVKAGQIDARFGRPRRQPGNDKSAGLPIWTTAGRPQGGAQGCVPSNPADAAGMMRQGQPSVSC